MTAATRQEAFVEGVKEFGRIVVIAAVSAAIVAAQSALGVVTDPNWNFLLGAVLTFLGKAWDKYVHVNPENSANGVVPF